MESPTIQIFGISNCDSMKKARSWLTEHNVEYEFHDYKKAGIDKDTLRNWISAVGWELLVNRRGTTWRKVPQVTKDSIDENTAIQLMMENTSIIKRPVLIMGDHVEVGFNSEQYAKVLLLTS